MTDCVFCKIVAGEIPSYKIYEDEKYLAFLDIFPLCEGQTLIIPKEHARWVWDVPNLGEYYEVVGKIARHFQNIIGGGVVRQTVFGIHVAHAHIHLKPGQENTMKEEKLPDAELAKIQKKYSMI